MGHFYDVITNGFGVMYAYDYRIQPLDRWAIVAYIRALQLSQDASTQDIPIKTTEAARRAAMNGSPPGAQRYNLDPAFRRIQPIALIVGLAAAAASAAGLFLAGPEQFFRSYLVAFLFWGSVSLGALAMAMLHYLVGGNWGFLIRRGLEGGYRNSGWRRCYSSPSSLGCHTCIPGRGPTWSPPAQPCSTKAPISTSHFSSHGQSCILRS